MPQDTTPAASSIDKLTALVAAITGFITAIIALAGAFLTFPDLAKKVFPQPRESGFIKVAKEKNDLLDKSKIPPTANPTLCNFSRQTYADLRMRIPRADRIKDITKSFDEADLSFKRKAEYRSLSQIFIDNDDVHAWRDSAAKNGCLAAD